MGNVVVTLTGEDAILVKMYLRAIAKNKDLENGLKSTEGQGRKTKASLDKLGQTDFKQMIEGLHRANAAASTARLEVDGLLADVLTRIGSIQAVTAVATSGINSMKEAQKSFLEQAIKSADAVLKIAGAQNQLSQNLAGSTSVEIDDATRAKVPEIMRSANFADAEAITRALGAVGSIVGKDDSVEVTQLAAEFTRHQKELLQPLATAIADLMKATKVSAKEAAALLFSEAAIARPEDISKLAQASVVAVQTALGASPQNDPMQAAIEGGSALAVLTKVDPQGASGGTATVDLFKLLKSIFAPDVATQEDRRLRIDDLREKQRVTADEQTAIDRANFNLQRVQQFAGKIPESDKSQFAESKRLELREAESRLNKAKQSAVLSPSEESELKQLSAVVEVKDPGGLIGRLREIQESPELRIFAEDRLTGEAKFQDILRGFFDKNSKHFAELLTAMSTVNLRPETTRQALENQAVTPQQRLADLQESSKVTTSLRNFDDRASVEAIAAMVDAEVKAGLEENRLGFWRETKIAMGRYAASWFFEDPDSISSVTANSTQAVDLGTSALRMRRSDIINDQDPSTWTEETREAVESLDRRIATLEQLRPISVASEQTVNSIIPVLPLLPTTERRESVATPQKQDSTGDRLLAELQTQNELMRQQNELLRDSRPENRPNPPPNPALIIPQQSLRN